MKVLLVEDDEIFVAALAANLASQNYTVESVTDGQQGWQYAQATVYDLIILDINLPGLDGISLCRQLRTVHYKGAILLLTAQDNAHSKVAGLDAGADDYVVKPCTTEELAARIRALLRRPHEITNPILHWGALQLDPSTCQVSLDSKEITLSPKEYGLLELFLRNPQRIFSNAMLLERLWGFEETPGDETIRTHIKRLRRKLKSAGAEGVIENVYGMGYRLTPPPAQSLDQPTQDVTTKADEARAAAIAALGQFSDVIADRLAILKEAANALQSTDTLPEPLHQQARQAAHKLVGSLGMFGLNEESNVSKQIENSLSQSPAIENSDQLYEWVLQLSHSLETVLAKVNVSPAVIQTNRTKLETTISAIHPEAPTMSLLVVSPAAEFIKTLVNIAPKTLHITQAIDLDQAHQQLNHRSPQSPLQPPFNLLLLDTAAFDEPSAISSFLDDLSNTNPDLLIFVRSHQDTFQMRLDLARHCRYTFLPQSTTAQHILNTILERCRYHFPVNYHVVAVDDDSVILAKIEQQLSSWGMQVTPLSNPEQLWQMLPQIKPDLVMLDVEMPQVGGIELCRVIRSDCQWDNIPIVFLSAQTDPETIQQGYTSGADDYITKPYTSKMLAARLINKIRRIGSHSTQQLPLQSN